MLAITFISTIQETLKHEEHRSVNHGKYRALFFKSSILIEGLKEPFYILRMRKASYGTRRFMQELGHP